MPELYKKKWFIDKSHNGEFEIIYVDLNEHSDSCSKSNSSIDLDEILQRTIQSKELDDVSSISSMDDEELESLTNVLQNRIDEIDAEDNKPVKTTDPETTTESQLIEPLFPEREEGCVRLMDSRSSVGVYDKSAPHCIQVAVSNPEEPTEPKIIYPETDEYNFDGFDIDVQMGGEQTTFSNTVIDTELEDELDMETIINMREFLQNKVFFAKFHDMPVNYCFMERLEETLDDLLNKTGGISEEEWLSILFQVVFGLAVANKHYSFVHNDLHSDNILFQSTKETYIYYAIKDVKDIKDKSVAKKKEKEDTTSKSKGKYKIYRIPTFGKVTKIIDFARATFKLNDKWIFSDVFMPNGEAAGQYKFPDCVDKEYWGCDFIGADEPNPSFDLARLARSVKHQVNVKSVYSLIKKWSKSDDGSNMLDKEDDFDL
jgi:hypothetical protein